MTKIPISAYTNLTLAMVIVGSSVVFGKVITESFPIFLASGLRFGIACFVMIPVLVKWQTIISKINRKELFKLLFMAFCGQFVFTFLLLLGLRYTSAIEAGIITSTSPAVMTVVAFLLFKERPQKQQVAGVGLVVLGVVVINGLFQPQNLSAGVSNILGNTIVMGAVLGEAFFLLMRKQISTEISNMELTAILSFLGFLMFLPFSIYQGITFDFSSVSSIAWISMLYFGAVFTVLAYLFWFKGVEKVSGNTAGVFTAVMPVSAVVISCIFLKEVLTVHHLTGGALILAAIFMTTVNADMIQTMKGYFNNELG